MVTFGFKTQKPRTFEYRPRFYDPDKEAREVRKSELLGDDAVHATDEHKEYKPGQYIGQMRMRRGIIANRTREKQRSSIIKVAIVVFLIGLMCVWIFFT